MEIIKISSKILIGKYFVNSIIMLYVDYFINITSWTKVIVKLL